VFDYKYCIVVAVAVDTDDWMMFASKFDFYRHFVRLHTTLAAYHNIDWIDSSFVFDKLAHSAAAVVVVVAAAAVDFAAICSDLCELLMMPTIRCFSAVGLGQ
jgi:hypothetical protein